MATTTTTETLAGETCRPAKVRLAVIVVPLPLQGHLNQLLHLSRRISARGIPEVTSVSDKIVIIYDSLMAHVVQDIRSVPNAKSYCFESISAFALYSYFWETSGKPVLPAGAEVVGEAGPTEGSYPPELLEFVGMVDSSPSFNSGEILHGPVLSGRGNIRAK
ncbi:Unknown protein [Striga hermonthica]|uniref:Glycosyltransferase N-terminal domain-containing protein n=1 Tax=Striga hermonthica TaxID=68872 RepID=A0A9N7MKC3_STRHE|nr:Unknown protein [Striga hermonthica]